MPSKKMIKRRIASVTTTKKIVTAMHLVSSSKLQKNRVRLEDSRPFHNGINQIMQTLGGREEIADNVFFQTRAEKNVLYLIITSDSGLCGGFNNSLAEKALQHMRAHERVQLSVVGQKGYDFFLQRGKTILHKYNDVLETAFFKDAARIGYTLADAYIRGEADAVYVAYTHFESALIHVPHVEKLLPIAMKNGDLDRSSTMHYEPDVHDFLDKSIPFFINSYVYNALQESSACEQAARMLNMDAATKNASDILTKLTRMYHRDRQSAITQEINEIVSGTNILKQGG